MAHITWPNTRLDSNILWHVNKHVDFWKGSEVFRLWNIYYLTRSNIKYLDLVIFVISTSVPLSIIVIFKKWKLDRIIALREEVSAHQTSLTLPLFIEVPVTSHESERSCIFALGVSKLPLYDFGGFWNCVDSVIFLFCFSL